MKIETIRFLLSLYEKFEELDDVRSFIEFSEALLAHRDKSDKDYLFLIDNENVLLSVKVKSVMALVRSEKGRDIVLKKLEELERYPEKNKDLIATCKRSLGLNHV